MECNVSLVILDSSREPKRVQKNWVCVDWIDNNLSTVSRDDVCLGVCPSLMLQDGTETRPMIAVCQNRCPIFNLMV